MKTKKAQTTPRPKILIVDDDPTILEVYGALLEEAGYQVDKAEHALAAVAAIVRAAPDLILADIRMPIVDGKELVQELRSHTDSRGIPVIAVTGFDSPGSREAALAAGYDEYITKPIDPKTFGKRVGELLEQFAAKKK
jgi:CheY-like chemotaxis protein